MNQTIEAEARRYNHLLSEIDAVYHEIALKQGFSDSTLSVLYTLYEHRGSCLLGNLVKQSGISKQTINSALRKLEHEGIIFLEPAGGKSKRISLTPKGTLLAQETAGKVIAMENKIYDSWKPEEWALYLELTERFLNGLRKEMKELTYEHSTLRPL